MVTIKSPDLAEDLGSRPDRQGVKCFVHKTPIRCSFKPVIVSRFKMRLIIKRHAVNARDAHLKFRPKPRAAISAKATMVALSPI